MGLPSFVSGGILNSFPIDVLDSALLTNPPSTLKSEDGFFWVAFFVTTSFTNMNKFHMLWLSTEESKTADEKAAAEKIAINSAPAPPPSTAKPSFKPDWSQVSWTETPFAV